MSTTQSGGANGRGAGDLLMVAGVLLAPLAFVFGGYALLAALPGMWRPLRPAAFVYFGAALVCLLVSIAGWNPWANHVRESLLDELEAALGSRPTFTRVDHAPGEGVLRFLNLRVDVPQARGQAEIAMLSLAGGPGWLFGTPTLTGHGLRVEFDGDAPALPEMLRGLRGGRDWRLELHSIEVAMRGQVVSARAILNHVRGSSDAGGFDVLWNARSTTLSLWQREHQFDLRGGGGFAMRDGRAVLSFDMVVQDSEDAMRGYLAGSLGGERPLQFTLDSLDIGAYWARYRVMDRYRGTLRGTIGVHGGLDELVLEPRLTVRGLDYYHRIVMGLDQDRAFRFDEGTLEGRVAIVQGRAVRFDELTLASTEATLSTGPRLSARGGGSVTLRGTWPDLRGEFKARVDSGLLREPISWSPLARSGLADLQPNLVQVAEQFPSLRLDFDVEVNGLRGDCWPLSGELRGRLRGAVHKHPALRESTLRAEGELALHEGRFAFCAASGEAAGRIVFRADAPAAMARLEGSLRGAVGDTPLVAEVGGTLARPALAFTGVTMKPEELGRLIVTHGAPDAMARAARRAAVIRLCGPSAAASSNPFAAAAHARVTFTFAP